MHGHRALISSFSHRSSIAFVPPRLLIAEGRDNHSAHHSALRRSFFTSAAAVHDLALHKPLAFVRQKASSAGLKMGVLDHVPLVFANGSSPQAPPSAPLLCLFFSAQWCPGKLLVSLLVYFESCCEVVVRTNIVHHVRQTTSTTVVRLLVLLFLLLNHGFKYSFAKDTQYSLVHDPFSCCK